MINKIYQILSNKKKNLIISFLFFFIFFFTLWIKKTFGDQTSYSELIYNVYSIFIDYQTLPLSYKINFLLYTLNTSFFFASLLIILIEKYKIIFFSKNKFFLIVQSIPMIKFLLLNYKIYIFYSILFLIIQFKFHHYFYSILQYQVNSKLYFDAKNIKFIEPTEKKNLILIYFESLEYDVNNILPKNKKNPLQELEKLSGKNIFNFKQSPATSISIAGIFASQCSTPLYPYISKRIKEFNQKKLRCLSDVLNDFNYKQFHFMTVDKTFHRSNLFLENHHYKIYDNHKIRQRFPNAKNSWGDGVFDDLMFNLAKEKILQLKKNNDHFNVVIKTTDTHPPFITSPTCKNSLNKKFDNDKTYEILEQLNDSYMKTRAYNAYKCTSILIKNFLDDLKKESVLSDTIVLIMGDHLAHNKYDIISNNNEERNLYFKINTKNIFTRNLMNHFDIAPTILHEMGFLPEDINQYGFGISLFNSNENFNYDKHFKSVMNIKVITDFYIKKLFEKKSTIQ
ncbi:sulfatase-like hydrolase/transferase [Candidatus Pelagibacter sp.]|uniref:sulfatase-like hydrolase/transferase n=1 Tax=Candidatus Pelagibacter sp. TaxID=2024849 RepID=UPI003F85F706